MIEKIQNSKFKTQKCFGFTLIEMLVAVSLLALVIAMIVRLLLSSLRANKKSEALVRIKQSGDYALQTMARMIRNAQEITSCPGDSINFLNSNGVDTTLTCNTTNNSIDLGSDSLTTVASDIILSSCSFSYNPGVGSSPDSVTINFSLEKAATGPIEEKVEMSFKTTVSLRTY